MEGSRETTRVNGERSLPRFHTTLRATLQHPSQRSAQSRRRKGAVGAEQMRAGTKNQGCVS